MTDAPLFTLARADRAVILTPQQNLTEFDFRQLDAETAEILGQISKEDRPNVVVDFGNIEYTGSAALGFFVRLCKNTRSRGGEMVFCNVNELERSVLEVTRLDTLWQIFDTLEDAVAAVNATGERNAKATWTVVADRAMARIFAQSGGDQLSAITTLRHPESRDRMSDTVSDGPGSFRGGAIAGSEAGDPNQDYEHRTAAAFAREVATYLDGARQRGCFDRLVLVAAPLFLGSLRQSLSSPVRKLVEFEVAKDYTHLDGSDIQKKLGVTV